MPITDTFQRLPLSAIWIDRDSRQRRTVASEKLLRSIQQRGVYNPIIVRRGAPEGFEAILVAGEGRLDASLRLALPDIPVRWASDLSEIEAQIIELEENIKRTDLPWQDLIGATQRIHSLYLSLDEGWTMTETAEALGLTLGVVSMQLQVAKALPEARIAESDSYREAYNILSRREARIQGEALEELLSDPSVPAPATSSSGPSPATSGPGTGTPEAPPAAPVGPVVCGDFRAWAAEYSGPKFNFLHLDLPYGTGAMQGPQARGSEDQIYSDGPEVYFSLLDSFVGAFPRICSISAHLFFWCSSRIFDPRSSYARETWARLEKLSGVSWWPHPLIWTKSDNAGIAPDTRRGPRHISEVCLFGTVGSRQIVKVVADSYQSPSDRSLHPSAKPEPMLRHFFQLTTDQSTTLFDPTAGSGAALRAADSLGAKTVLGLEISQEHTAVANRAFRNARALRGASRAATPGLLSSSLEEGSSLDAAK